MVPLAVGPRSLSVPPQGQLLWSTMSFTTCPAGFFLELSTSLASTVRELEVWWLSENCLESDLHLPFKRRYFQCFFLDGLLFDHGHSRDPFVFTLLSFNKVYDWSFCQSAIRLPH